MSKFLDKDGVAYLWNKISDTFKKKEASVSISVSPSLFEKGVSTTISVSWASKLDGSSTTADSCAVTVGGTVISDDSGGNGSYSTTVTDTTACQVTSVISGTTKTASATATAVYPMYFGSSANSSLSSADVLAMTKQSIKSSPSGSYSVTVAEGNYMWLCVPSTMTINKVTSSGFDVPMEAAASVEVSGKTTYKCYRSSSTYVAGTVSIVVS